MSDENLNLAERYEGEFEPLPDEAKYPSPSDRDRELIRQAQNDQSWAIEQLIRRHQKKVFAIAYQMSFADKEEAKDRTQEALLQAIRNIKQFKGNSSFSTWLYRIAINICIDAQRRKRRWKKVFLPWPSVKHAEKDFSQSLEDYPDMSVSTDQLSKLSRRQLERDVKNALKLLSDKQRIVFQLKIFQEMSIREISEVIGLAEGTVKTHLFRATQLIRNQLREWSAP